jgi:hypothetical protein
MAKKIEVDIAYLKSIGLSQKQISDIIKNAEPDHWTNKLPQEKHSSYELTPFMICPDLRRKGRVELYCEDIEPTHSFFKENDAEFIQNKCRLLIEMSNFSFAVNENWCPDWNDKEEKKFGIVLQNGQARVSENELFNLYVFGIVTKTRSLALEMLEEFKDRVETYFNKPFNSVSETVTVETILPISGGVIGVAIGNYGNTTNTQVGLTGTIYNTDSNPDFIGSFAPRYDATLTRKKRKTLIHSDIAKIQDMLLKNVPQKEIATELDYSQGTISRLKESLGFKMKIKKKINPNTQG